MVRSTPSPPWVQPKSTLGSRRIEAGFFDRHPRFFETSETSPQSGRLNLRHEAIISENADVLRGARVLDIASHDGRWSLAALEAGATSLLGVEARADLVAAAKQNLSGENTPPVDHDFVTEDVFEFLRSRPPDVDVVLCLGFFYHTLRFSEFLAGIRSCGPSAIILDTLIMPRATRPVVRLFDEPTTRQGNAVPDEFSFGDSVVVGRPSMPALELMLGSYGYRIERLSDWGGLLRDNPEADGIGDYADGRRITARIVPVE